MSLRHYCDPNKVGSMNIFRLVTLLVLLALNTSGMAAITLSETMQAFHSQMSSGTPLENILRQQLQDHYDDADVVLTGAISSTPGNTGEIVRIAIGEGVLAEDIAAQCETMLNQDQLVDLIRVAFVSRIDPEPVIRRCFSYLPGLQIPELLALAINNSTPGDIERVLQVSFLSLTGQVVDPFATVKEAVLLSNAFTVEGIEFAEDVDDLVTEIRLQDVLENATAEQFADVGEIADADAPPPVGDRDLDVVGGSTTPPPDPAPPIEPPLSDS